MDKETEFHILPFFVKMPPSFPTHQPTTPFLYYISSSSSSTWLWFRWCMRCCCLHSPSFVSNGKRRETKRCIILTLSFITNQTLCWTFRSTERVQVCVGPRSTNHYTNVIWVQQHLVVGTHHQRNVLSWKDFFHFAAHHDFNSWCGLFWKVRW